MNKTSEVCESLIHDYLSGSLPLTDLEQAFSSIFNSTPTSHVEAHKCLQDLYTSNKVDSDQFTEISSLISKVNIQSTLSNNTDCDVSYFDADKTLHITELSEMEDDGYADETVIIRVSKEGDDITDSDISAQRTEIIAKPKRAKRYDNLGPGVTLKERFVLLEKLGQGGMGVVFKAKDLLKVEAQDKDPYVAIKVLTDAFKKYSGSFIALQREASKAQRLAHPNIATVYDFDRDANTVFMTMEYLKGKPINQLIKELNKKPLKLDHALNIIEQLCSGLAYAHEKLLIHSDFKPGNCFLLDDGIVKLLDFGIARASTQTDEERDNTMFDPAKLCAVTPAYATPEMFAGMSPDPRDDIYGLACVSYQLLAGGKHPYNKVASPKIKELGIKPKPIKGLNRKQQKTLMRALAINREDRIESVEQYADGMRSKKSHAKQIILGALFIAVISAGIGYKPFLAFMEQQQLYDKIQLIKQGDIALLLDTIWSLEQLDEEQQKIILVGLRREIITHYRERIRSAFYPKEKLHDYPQALNFLLQAKRLYPDSVALSTIEDQIKEQKDRLMLDLTSKYESYLRKLKLLKTESGKDMPTVIRSIKRVDPEHFLLRDKKLPNLYLSSAETLLSERKYKGALQYIVTGLKLFPEDTRLQNLNKQINAQYVN